MVMLIALWVVLSGVGGYVWQNDDHLWRNTIFDILVKEDWPVLRPMEIDGAIQERGLIYYIGFWLPAGLIGKLFGREAGYAFQCVWAILGIVIFYSLICYWRKKVSLWPLLIFIFFSGLDIVGTLCNGEPLMTLWGVEHLERWPGIYQYSSMTTQLFWVFNQAVPVWIACGLLFLRPHPQNCIMIWASVMLTSTLPFVGLFPYVAYIILKGDKPIDQYGSVAEYFKEVWKRLASIPNIVCGGAIGIISGLYLIQNTVGGMLERITQIPVGIFIVLGLCLIGVIVGFVWLAIRGYLRRLKLLGTIVIACGVAGSALYLLGRGYPINKIFSHGMLLLWFYLLEAGIYLLLLRQKKSQTGLWWLCSITLLIFPLIKIGTNIDFCMRASIPGLILIYFWVIKRFEERLKTAGTYILCIVIILGGITSLHEIARTVAYSSRPYKIDAVAEETILTGRNFSGEATGFFWKYIAK
ncbi:MAG: hypothetical protein HDR02_01305 [Lachnospiraceae bacterium]|nr:hypothetical protein [Lachnospiraceae bacterium]